MFNSGRGRISNYVNVGGETKPYPQNKFLEKFNDYRDVMN